ncbi:MAG TPA: PEGA domain-containing protein [Polyangiaceae bacterium]|nr:PEGA domain-containing protein [Polyangiaceae bacterium]
MGPDPRRVLVAVAVALALRPLAAPRDALAQPAGAKPDAKPEGAKPADAKALVAEGDKAAKAKDWPKALAAYEAANRAEPGEAALAGAANALYQLKREGEAHAAYSAWLETYGDKAPADKKARARARLKELEKKTGALTLTVSEPGASIAIDGKPVGTSPPAGPIRLSPGARQVRVEKEGFLPFDRAVSVVVGGAHSVDVKLEAQSPKGRLLVKEKAGQPLRVLVDGVDVGEAPWAGEVEPGLHEVTGRSATLAAAPEQVQVERGKSYEIELAASSAVAPVKIATSDGKGLIYLDGKVVGEGSFSADVPAGAHKIRIVREGYDPFEEEILVKDKEPFSRAVTLTIASKVETGPIAQADRPLEGVYGGLGVGLSLLPGGTGNSIEKGCDDAPPELVGCEAGSPLGVAASGFVGYHWDPVGVELFLAGGYDVTRPQRDWGPSSTDPGIGPDPPRVEDFTVRRFGGLAAARVRFTAQGEKLRFTVAGGVGVSRRLLALERDTRAKDDPSLRDVFATPADVGYWAPVVSLDPMLMYRLGGPTALGLGVSLLVESPSTFLNDKQTPTTAPEGNHRLGPSGLTTPAYELASGTQFFVGPFVAIMFGP